MKTKIAFKQVYEEFQPQIRHYLSRLVGPHEAEDVAQEVFAKVSRQSGRF
jgi:DNA-directed RNA polymerase specialized sigma24 family protein